MKLCPVVKYVVDLAAFVLIALGGSAAFAQLPGDVKSDLGPGMPAFKVRPGYRVTRALPPNSEQTYRFLQFSEDGKTLYASVLASQSDRATNTILALRDNDGDGVFETVKTFVKEKRSVQGMDVRNGWLYFSRADEGSVSRARDTNGDGVADDVEVIVPPGTIPGGGGHPYEGLLVTDKEIYVTCSDPTNMTFELDSPRKTIYIFDLDGKNKRVFCTGIRNTEKLRFRPGTTDIYGFDHGSDNFGLTYGEVTLQSQPITDVNPNEEFNKYVQGGFYGHPYIMGNGVPRPEGVRQSGINVVDLASKTIAPEWLVHAHWAVCGFTFISKDYFPGAKGDVFFCSHGSWDSVKPVGAVVERIMFDPITGRPCGSMTIVDCQDEGRLGTGRTTGPGRLARPVDIAEAPDGSLVFSSDQPSGLFRISRSTKGGE